MSRLDAGRTQGIIPSSRRSRSNKSDSYSDRSRRNSARPSSTRMGEDSRENRSNMFGDIEDARKDARGSPTLEPEEVDLAASGL